MKKISLLMIFSLLALIFFSCIESVPLKKIQFHGEAQGTYYAVTYFASDSSATQLQIDSLLKDFDLSASIWKENSIISKINRNESGVVLNQHFIDIFKRSQRVSEITGGAFDITVGPLVNAWGFGFKNKMNVTQQVVDSLLPLVNYRAVKLENGNFIKENPNIQIDFNAIAQGYSVDLIGGFLEKKGITNYLVDVGGEVLGKGIKPDGNQWTVGIEKPTENQDSDRQLKAVLNIKNKAIATSGNYRKFYEVDGIRFSHTIDPKTGYPVKHSLLSTTVLADSASIADAYATAFMVMGVEKTQEFLKVHPELEVYLIYSGETGELKTWRSTGIVKMIEEQ